MKKSFKSALAVFYLMAAGAFFMGCSSPSGAGSYTPKYAVGDIVFNDGTKGAYSVIYDKYDFESQEFKDDILSKAVAVIFRPDTKTKPALGVGIKFNADGLKWCNDKSVKGYSTGCEDIVCDPDDPEAKDNLTFKNSLNTDGSTNLFKMINRLAEDNDTGVNCNEDGTIDFSSSDHEKLKTNYPAFEFAYYYGKNDDHNTKGTVYETGWYLPSVSELNDISRANLKDNKSEIIRKALKMLGSEGFDRHWYWSSSQYSFNTYCIYMLEMKGGKGSVVKDTAQPVCAIRAFN